jgi:hypothetical protein
VTCIIASPRGIWADRIITSSEGDRCDSICKVIANPWFVVGFAGPLEAILAGLDLAASEESLDDLALATTKVTGLAVRRNRLFVLELGKVWPKPRNCAFWAVGTGGEAAMAFLAGRGKTRPGDIMAAHKFVAAIRDDCGRGVDHRETP